MKNVSGLNDSTFIANVSSIESIHNQFFLSLYLGGGSSQILQLGPDLDLRGIIQRNGKGPGEFTSVTDMSIINDSLYVYNETQAKILVFDHNKKFIRETKISEASASHMAVDERSHFFLSTPSRSDPITKFSAEGQQITTFGRNTIGEDSRHYRRNSRMLFIYNDRLIAIGRSEPVLEVYSLEGTFLSTTRIDPPEIHELIAYVREENEDPDARGFSLLFFDAAIHNNNIYLLVAKHPNENTKAYDTNFTFLFKYKLNTGGGVTHEQTFKLFRSDQDKLMYGSALAVTDDHKIIVNDMMGKSLLMYEDERL
ncbi:6-bladed beta-propeller [Aliifodinibius salicampi]|uniref:6-bladed beta-propeller n=1 Tax=Fodinibius salicampi TaxID=1920655 RepID=A0ABT3PWL3_9BACT|nr:6-bladed beta-propeller [Fodinibius salicampi]